MFVFPHTVFAQMRCIRAKVSPCGLIRDEKPNDAARRASAFLTLLTDLSSCPRISALRTIPPGGLSHLPWLWNVVLFPARFSTTAFPRGASPLRLHRTDNRRRAKRRSAQNRGAIGQADVEQIDAVNNHTINAHKYTRVQDNGVT